MANLKGMDLIKLMDEYHSEEKCREILEQLRWPHGVACILGLCHPRHPQPSTIAPTVDTRHGRCSTTPTFPSLPSTF